MVDIDGPGPKLLACIAFFLWSTSFHTALQEISKRPPPPGCMVAEATMLRVSSEGTFRLKPIPRPLDPGWLNEATVALSAAIPCKLQASGPFTAYCRQYRRDIGGFLRIR
jgi:hypothetical protein